MTALVIACACTAGSLFTNVTHNPTGEPKPGDLDGDGLVSAPDLAVILSFWNTDNETSDLSGDGVVNAEDLATLISLWDAAGSPLSDGNTTRGVSWCDYDQDGDYDLYISNWQEENKLLRNEGGGVFTDQTAGPLDNNGAGGRTSFADFDNDGDLDAYLCKFGPNALLRNDAGVFVDATGEEFSETNDDNGMGASWVDYDLDGDVDLYVVNRISENKLFRNDGALGFVNVTPPELAHEIQSRSGAWADFDNDGDPDLYLVAGGAPDAPANSDETRNRLYRNDGAMGFVDVTRGVEPYDGPEDLDGDGTVGAPDLAILLGAWGSGAGPADVNESGDVGADDLAILLGSWDTETGPLGDRSDGRGVVWGDYDNDGDLDLYVCNLFAPNRLLRNDGGLTFTDVSAAPLNDEDSVSRGACWGDYDNDGDLDLYIAKGTTNRLFRNDGESGFVDVSDEALADAGVGAEGVFADYDADGDLDLYLGNYQGVERNKLLRNNLDSGAAWLHLDLEGVMSNRSAIGAQVRATAGGVTQLRQVSGGNSYMAQPPLTVFFGFGAAAAIDSIEIRWPSGIVQTFGPVAVNHRFDVVESDVPGDVNGDGLADALDDTILAGP